MEYTKLQANDVISNITYKQALELIENLKSENDNIKFSYHNRDGVCYMTLRGTRRENRKKYRIKYQKLIF